MNNDIKEINITFPGQILDYVDTKEHLLGLYNYITNLQEKYERMKENVEILSNGYNDLEKRNEKAIELIEEHWGSYYMECGEGQKDLLNILEGADKE